MNLPSFAGRSVLVVGGAGYIGSVLTTLLLEAGAHVRVLDRLLYDNGFALQHLLDHERLSFVRGDLCDREVFARAADRASDVVLLGALVGDPICKKYPELALRVNQQGAERIIESLDELGVRRFVLASTCSNYGIQDPGVAATEQSVLNPQSLYARTKIAAERALLDRTRSASFAGTVLRFATAYGLSPRMRFDLTVSHFVWELASRLPLLVFDADTWRPYCHVRDISRAILTVLSQPVERVRGEIFNVGSDSQQFTKRMIVAEAQKLLGVGEVEYRPGDTDPRDYRVSFLKISEQLGFLCECSVEEYIPALIHAVRSGIFPDVRANARFGNYEVAEPAA